MEEFKSKRFKNGETTLKAGNNLPNPGLLDKELIMSISSFLPGKSVRKIKGRLNKNNSAISNKPIIAFNHKNFVLEMIIAVKTGIRTTGIIRFWTGIRINR